MDCQHELMNSVLLSETCSYIMKISRLGTALFLALAAIVHLDASAQQEKIKIGFVLFHSGPASSFGLPARDGAKLLVDALNRGEVPAPYSARGIAGKTIEAVFVDEAGNTQKQLSEYRRLVEREKVDLIIGYTSSANCNAIAPLAEELKVLTAFFTCAHSQLFEEIVPNAHYSVRTAPSGTMDQIGLARYLAEFKPQLRTVAGINQDYSYGRDSWNEFKAAMRVLSPEVRPGPEAFPKLGSGEYGAEVSALLRSGTELVYSSLWGGDLSAFVLQASNRGLPSKSHLALVQGYAALDDLGEKVPPGTIIGARGPHSYLAKPNALGGWFEAAYLKTYNRRTDAGASFISQAIFGVKAAYEKATASAGKQPTTEQVIQAMKRLEFPTISGFPVKMTLANGKQAIQGTAYAEYVGWDKQAKAPQFRNLRYYGAECVNPPEGMNSTAWIEAKLPGAKCD